jgi:hypothetical protein
MGKEVWGKEAGVKNVVVGVWGNVQYILLTPFNLLLTHHSILSATHLIHGEEYSKISIDIK